MKFTKAEQQEAIVALRLTIKPGDTLYTVVRHVSASGMTRSIDVYRLYVENGKAERQWLSRRVAVALGWGYDEQREAVKVGGAGMDMGFHLVYELGHVLFGDTPWRCTGKNDCPSNEHNNPPYPQPSRRVKHAGSGYALRQAWL